MSDTIESLRKERDAARAEVAQLKALLVEVVEMPLDDYDSNLVAIRKSVCSWETRMKAHVPEDWIARRDAACKKEAT